LIRSQDLEPRFHDAGQFVAGKGDAFSKYKAVLFGHCLPLLVDKEQAIDIDNEEDWNLAEKLFSIMAR
jgi:N-acylneuraminate cytidylyltransferase